MRDHTPAIDAMTAPLPAALDEEEDGDEGLLVEAALARVQGDPGRELPGELRVDLEDRLGSDLSGVRVHDGPGSAAAAGGLGTVAFTVGQDIHLDRAAGAVDGGVLAHEAAHAVQQRGAGPAAGGPAIAAEGSYEERDAEAFEHGRPVALRPTGVQQIARHPSGPQQKKKGAHARQERAESDDLLALDRDCSLLEAFAHCTALAVFGEGRIPEKAVLADTHDEELLERVRAALVFYRSPGMAGREKMALDLWGAARPRVKKAIERMGRPDGDARVRAAAKDGADRMDVFLGELAADKATGERASDVDMSIPDAGFLKEEQVAVDRAAGETMSLIKKAQGPLAGELDQKAVSAASAGFELFYLLAIETPDLEERVKKARARGLIGKAEGAAEVLKLTLSAAKKTVSAVSKLAAVAWPAAKAEAGDVFARLARMAADDDAKLVGNVIGQALVVVEVVSGALGLIDGILEGDGRAALKAAEKLAGGGVSGVMLAAGAGAGVSAVASGLVTMWFGMINACLDLGASLRRMERNHKLEVVHDFVTGATRIAQEGTELAAACQEMIAPSRHSDDAEMQEQVVARIEARADGLAKDMAVKMSWLDGEVTANDDDSLGHYPEIVAAMGPEARHLLRTLGGHADQPLILAQGCITVFMGLNRMGAYAMARYGDDSDSKESRTRRAEIDEDVAEENGDRGLVQ